MNSPDRDAQIAETIRQQVGQRALFMLGAKHLLRIGPKLSFQIRGSRKVKAIEIELAPDDTYNITFTALKRKRDDATGFFLSHLETVARHTGLHADQLHPTIETVTGLATHL